MRVWPRTVYLPRMHVVVESRPWEFGWVAVAGIATALLASFTAVLAFSTRALAKETDEDVQASSRPIVLANEDAFHGTLTGRTDGDYRMEIQLALINSGRGPAINCTVTGARTEGAGGPHWGTKRVGTIPVGHARTVGIHARGVAAQAPSWDTHTHVFNIRYEDIGRNLHLTRLTFSGGPPGTPFAGHSIDMGSNLDDTEVTALSEKAPLQSSPDAADSTEPPPSAKRAWKLLPGRRKTNAAANAPDQEA